MRKTIVGSGSEFKQYIAYVKYKVTNSKIHGSWNYDY
jgi:hypothetical protein